MFRISLFITILAFFLLRPYAFSGGIIYSGDDWSYFAHASSIAFGQFPFYSHEYWMTGKGLPAHMIGSGILAAPFVAVFSLIDCLIGSDIVVQRTSANVLHSWALFGFVFASGFYLWVGCAFLFYGLRKYFTEHIASWSVILLVLFEGMPLYAFRRPVFSHIFAFVVSSFFVYMLLSFMKHQKRMRWIHVVMIALGVGLTILIRANNIFSGIAWPLIFVIFCMPQETRQRKLLVLTSMGAIVAAMILFFYVLPAYVVPHEHMDMGSRLWQRHGIEVIVKRIIHILIGLDWGLVFTAPFMIIALLGFCWIRTEVIKPLRYAAVLLSVNAWIIIQWMTQGGWYGYRYFVFSVFPIVIYSFAFILKEITERWKEKGWFVVAVIAVFPFLSMICFEGNNSNLTLHTIVQYFGVEGWGNNTYQLEVWKSLVYSPLEFLQAIVKGGPLYLVYLVLNLLHQTSMLPIAVQVRYPIFTWDIFFKTMIIYLMPFSLWGITTMYVNGISCIDKSKRAVSSFYSWDIYFLIITAIYIGWRFKVLIAR